MESGVVPPPARRSAPKSLVGARDVGRQSEPGTTPSMRPAPHADADDGPTLREKRLEEMLHAEATENRRLQAALKEQASKFERSLQHQSQLEEDVLSRDARIKVLGDELRILKQKKQSTDSELAQSTADYMNGQAKWLEQVDQLNDEIHVLKAKLSETKLVATELEKVSADLREKERRREAEERKKVAKAAKPDRNIQVAADSLEKHQNELLIKELRARHSQISAEMAEVKAVNERLREDNENFQYLLVERTVSGELVTPTDFKNTAGAGASGGNDNGAAGADGGLGAGAATKGRTLADEEVFDFDPAGGELRADTVIESPSLADEGNDGQSSSMTPTSEASDAMEYKDAKFLQKTINKQQFELQSLRNHNRALKASLERLVDRLLDNKMFSQAVEEAVSTNIVQKFRQRLASSTAELDRKLGNRISSGEGSTTNPGANSIPASTWSNMIFNAQYSGTPSRRVISLGVDSEYRPAPSPALPSNAGSAARTVSTSSSIDSGGPFGRVRGQAGRHPSPSAPSINSDSPSSEIYIPKRTDSQSGLRKLRLGE